MGLSKFKHVKISGISVVVPEKEINIYDEVQYYENNIKKIDRMRKIGGFWKRRVVDDTTTAGDLAYDAARNLINDLNINKNDIDALLFVVQSPDVRKPSTAFFIHNNLNLSENCIATDIKQGCAGWVFGLHIASMMIETGIYKKILLLNGDTPSAEISISNRNLAPVFGDAGSATLLEYTENETNSFFNIEIKSSGFETIITPFNGARFRLDLTQNEDLKLLKSLVDEKVKIPSGKVVPILEEYLNGAAVFDYTINSVPKNIKKLIQYACLNKSDISVLCLHQANKQIVQAVCTEAGFDLEKAPYTAFENYGNVSMCSIPIVISSLDKTIKKDKILCSGFGNGLICASAILNLQNTIISNIKIFNKPDYIKSRDEYINYWRNKFKGE